MDATAAPKPLHVRLRLRGAPSCDFGAGRAVPLEPKDAVLLAYLCIEGDTARALFVARMWPEVDEPRARANLRQRLLRMRRSTGIDLVGGGAQLAIAAGVGHDLGGHEELLAALSLEEAGGLGEWLERARSARLAARIEALAAQASRHEGAQRLAQAIVVAQRIIEVDPVSEHAHRRLMRLHYLRGDRAAALCVYERAAALLASELAARPSAETEHLRYQIEASPPSAVRAGPMPIVLLRPPRMVGRAHELEVLVAALTAGHHALVAGDAGMGKSRLLAELGHVKATLAVQGRPGDVHRPYVVLARLIRALHDIGLRPGPGACRELARIAPEIGTVPQTRFDRVGLENAVEELLEVAATRLDALVIDDLQFADVASIEALLGAVGASAQARLVFGVRIAEGDAVISLLRRSLGESARLEEIVLAALPDAAIEALLDSLSLPMLAPASLAQALARHTGGNPQFILETLKALFHGGGAPVLHDGRLPLPRSVGMLIEMRLKQLSAPAVKLARLAAIAGLDFSPALAAAVLHCDPLDFADAWAELEAAAVLLDHHFAHDLVYESTLAGVPAAIARSLHAEVAAVLTQQGSALPRIARHWLQAGAGAKALPLLLAAGREAKAATRNQEAVEHLDSAARVQAESGDGAGEFESLLALGDCLIDLDRRERLDAAIARLLELSSDDARRRARALELQGRTLLARARFGPALAAGQQALALALAAGDASTAFEARLVMTQSLIKLLRLAEAEAVLFAARGFAQSGATTRQSLDFNGASAWLVLAGERFEESRLLWQKVEATATELQMPRYVATALGYLTLCEGNIGAYRQAAATGERWRQFLLDHSFSGEAQEHVDLNLAYVYLNLGRFAEALAALQRAETQRVADRANLHARYAAVFAALGQFARVRQHLEAMAESEPLTPGMQLTRMLLDLRMDRIGGRRRLQAEGVEAMLAQAERVAGSSPKSLPRVRWLLARAEFLDGDEAVQAARQALQLASAKGMHGGRISAETLLASALLKSGDAAAALPSVRVALAMIGTHEPDFLYLPVVGQVAYDVLVQNGESRESRDAVLRATVDWIQCTAAHHVPAEFRDSFLHRNPVNAALLAAVTRLGTAVEVTARRLLKSPLAQKTVD